MISLDIHFKQFCELLGKTAQEVQNEINNALNTGTTDPAKILHIEFMLQQYSTMINFGSSIVKNIRDIVTNIISKI